MSSVSWFGSASSGVPFGMTSPSIAFPSAACLRYSQRAFTPVHFAKLFLHSIAVPPLSFRSLAAQRDASPPSQCLSTLDYSNAVSDFKLSVDHNPTG